jgi:hypothetical protein
MNQAQKCPLFISDGSSNADGDKPTGGSIILGIKLDVRESYIGANL